MAKPDTAQKEGQSWRDLDQTVNPRTLSSQGRRRLLASAAQTVLLGLLLAALLWGGWQVGEVLAGQGGPIADPVGGTPLREVVVINDADGVLSQEWVERVLGVRKGTAVLELDLVRLRERLLAVPQVRSAELWRDFPGSLVVKLHERVPVLRVRVQLGAAAPQTLLVARDGVVYEGIGYERARLAALPFLDGVRLVPKARGGFHPVEGMEETASLLQTVQNAAPSLYSDWRTVSLARFAGYDEIVVRTGRIPEVVFSKNIDFNQQLARLDYIASFAANDPVAPMQRVDLSQGNSVPVAFAAPDPKLLPPSFVKPSKPGVRSDL